MSKKTPFISYKFFDWWNYKRGQSFSRIWDVLKQFFLYIPWAYFELIVYIVVIIFALPVVLSKGAYHWLKRALVREINIEDHAALEDETQAEMIRKMSISDIKSSVAFFKQFISFILGVGITLLGIYLASKIGAKQ